MRSNHPFIFQSAKTKSSLQRILRVLLPVVLLVLCASVSISAQTLKYSRKPDAKNGGILYHQGCIACHGEEGRGAPQSNTEFKRPSTFPDFTRCAQTTPEPNSNWKDVILHGGPSRGFSTIMPAFGNLLSNDQVDDLIAYPQGQQQQSL